METLGVSNGSGFINRLASGTVWKRFGNAEVIKVKLSKQGEAP